jgi:hypothetical protein
MASFNSLILFCSIPFLLLILSMLVRLFNPHPANVLVRLFNPHPANVLVRLFNPHPANVLVRLFNPYPANVDKMVDSCQC